ncbi:MAG: NERD domain-containing protein, partial [Isosphaeraceae bacterium]
MTTTRNWTTVAESKYPWERDALGFVRQKFPEHEPYRAWANFEFIADDGSTNEVDLLVFTPMGFFLVDKKWSSRSPFWQVPKRIRLGGTNFLLTPRLGGTSQSPP